MNSVQSFFHQLSSIRSKKSTTEFTSICPREHSWFLITTLGTCVLTLPVFLLVRVTRSLVFCVVLCRSLFVILAFFFFPLYCLSFFDLRLLITMGTHDTVRRQNNKQTKNKQTNKQNPRNTES